MANWKYDLGETGKTLRERINECDFETCSDILPVMDALLACYAKIEKLLPEEDFSAFSSQQDDAQIVRDDIRDGEMPIDDAIWNVNFELDEFYDLCDLYRIWIST